MQVIALMAYGCPLEAVVKVYGLDKRTVNDWWQRVGVHCAAFHEQSVATADLDLQQVQADEIKVKVRSGAWWMGLAMMVSTRLWLGGVVSARRDRTMIETLVAVIRRVALCRPLLIVVDGLPHYVKAIQRAFRTAAPRAGQHGRPSLIAWPDVLIGRVIKRRTEYALTIERRILGCGRRTAASLIAATQGAAGKLNTAYVERLNATFRQRLVWLTRRSLVLAQQMATVEAGMYIVGCFYNFCDEHESLRLPLETIDQPRHWLQCTPAIAAGLTDHCWTPTELLTFRAPPPWTPLKRRGRQSQQTQALVARWCSSCHDY